MDNINKIIEGNMEKTMKELLKQGRRKLEYDLSGTKEAIKLIANERTKDFIKTMDKGLDKDERDFLISLMISSMYQSFCYGYVVGKMEGKANKQKGLCIDELS